MQIMTFMKYFVLVSVHIIFASGRNLRNDHSVYEYQELLTQLQDQIKNPRDECSQNNIGFQLLSDYPFLLDDNSILRRILNMKSLVECITECRNEEKCASMTFYKNVCILNKITIKHFEEYVLSTEERPGIYSYAEKFCMENNQRCKGAWQVEKVLHRSLNYTEGQRVTFTAETSLECYRKCTEHKEFRCRSAVWTQKSKSCTISIHNRATLNGIAVLTLDPDATYLENACFEESKRRCVFEPLRSRIVSYVDTKFTAIKNHLECRKLCLNSTYPCRSYSFDSNTTSCFLSHHFSGTVSRRLAYKPASTRIQTFELVACYDLKLSCLADRFVADIITTRLFDGKVYLKNNEAQCALDVNNSLAFRYEVNYEDEKCPAKLLDKGFYLIDVVIQYFDHLVTFNDIWLSTTCQYDIRDQTLINDYDLGVYDIKASDYDDILTIQPEIEMSVIYPNGSYILETADVGDLLTLKFDAFEHSKNYGFFIKRLYVTDSRENSTNVPLIEAGCPVPPYLVSPPYKNNSHVLVDFKAFKYTTSKFVRFVAVLGSCETKCEPVNCTSDEDGEIGLSAMDEMRLEDADEETIRSKVIELVQNRIPTHSRLIRSVKETQVQTSYLTTEMKSMISIGILLIMILTIVILIVWISFILSKKRMQIFETI